MEETVWPTKPKILTGPLIKQIWQPLDQTIIKPVKNRGHLLFRYPFNLKFQAYEEVEKLEQRISVYLMYLDSPSIQILLD